MKVNTKKPSNHRGILVFIAVILIIGVGIGLVLAYDELKEIYIEQCAIRDVNEQVTIHAGKMVPADAIAAELGLIKGANLALIDFAAAREKLLKRIPSVRDLLITRNGPDRVSVIVEERVPIAKVNAPGARRVSGKVVDDEGVIFVYQRGTKLLPTIYSASGAIAKPGTALTGMSKAALMLLRFCTSAKYADLAIQDIDTTHKDFLLCTLGDYSRAKIAWDGMSEPDEARQGEDLEHRLDNLMSAIRSHIADGAKTWNATIPDRIFADTQEKR